MSSLGGSLQFRIFNCTSEDPEYPVNELVGLVRDIDRVRGWQSQRFCVYPQELVLQLSHPARIKQIHILSHQHKIASRIDLFTFMPDVHKSNFLPSANSVQFTRLGHFTLDDNARSNYQARELKTVYIDIQAA